MSENQTIDINKLQSDNDSNVPENVRKLEEAEATAESEGGQSIDKEDVAAESEEARRKRLYDNYKVDDPEDMDEAPDTGDMFDDDELDIDDEYYYSSESFKKPERRSSNHHSRITLKTLAALWTLFVILLGGYIYCFFINKTLFTDNVAGRDNSVLIEVPENAVYSLCTVDSINQLINNYLLARTNVDQSTLRRVVTDPSEYDDMTAISMAAQYITAYNRTTCYIAPGFTTESTIVYELSNLVIKDVDSSPLDIRCIYVTRQADGTYKINNSELSDQEKEYIDKITATDDVQRLYKHVKENNDYLLKTDATLKAFQDMYSK